MNEKQAVEVQARKPGGGRVAEQNRPPRNQTLQFVVTPSDRQRIESAAREKGWSVSAWVRAAVREKLRRVGR